MSLEAQIIKLFGTKKYRSYRRFIQTDLLSRPAATCLSAIDERPEEDITDWKDFLRYCVLIHNPTMSEEDRTVLKHFIIAVHSSKPSINTIRSLSYRDIGDELIARAAEVADGATESFDKIHNVMQRQKQFEREFTRDEQQFDDNNFDAIVDDALNNAKYKFPLECLNKSLGGCSPGDFIVVAGLPDSGKTSLVAFITTFLSQQTPPDRPVLWLNNEESDARVRLRMVQAVTGLDQPTIREQRETALKKYSARLGGKLDRIRVRGIHGLEVAAVEQMIEENNPGVIVIDQLSKVLIGGQRAETQQLTELAGLARGWSQSHDAPVFTTNWASSDAEGKLWIPQTMLYNSRIGIPGEADAILTLGVSGEPGMERTRGLHVAKSKMHSEPGYANMKREITIYPDVCQFEEIGNDEVPI